VNQQNKLLSADKYLDERRVMTCNRSFIVL
jgi:hypothetical protein